MREERESLPVTLQQYKSLRITAFWRGGELSNPDSSFAVSMFRE
jgi:hypothetical protein